MLVTHLDEQRKGHSKDVSEKEEELKALQVSVQECNDKLKEIYEEIEVFYALSNGQTDPGLGAIPSVSTEEPTIIQDTSAGAADQSIAEIQGDFDKNVFNTVYHYEILQKLKSSIATSTGQRSELERVRQEVIRLEAEIKQKSAKFEFFKEQYISSLNNFTL